MRLINTVAKFVIVLATIIVTSTAAFVEADIHADGTMNTPFPSHWGPPPRRQTRDYVPLPEPYGRGSSTLKKWIEEKMAEDAVAGEAHGGTERRFADTSSTTSWPEKILTGMTGEDAQKEINKADSSLEVQILPPDSMMTMDFREDRVRIMVDANGIVVDQPRKG